MQYQRNIFGEIEMIKIENFFMLNIENRKKGVSLLPKKMVRTPPYICIYIYIYIYNLYAYTR